VKEIVNRLLGRAGLESTIARNSVLLLVSEGLGRAVNLIISIMLYRYLQPEGAGAYRFVISYGVLFGICSELGLTRSAVREIARSRREELARTMGHLTVIRSVISAMTLALIWGSLLTPMGASIEPRTKLCIVLWSGSVFFQAFRRNSEIVFQALEKLQYQALFLAVNRVLAVVFVSAAVLAKASIEAVFIGYLAADLVDAVGAAWLVRRRIERPEYDLQREPMVRLVRLGIPFALQQLAGQVHYYVNSVLIYYLLNDDLSLAQREIGLFQSSYQIVLTLVFIPLSVCNSLYAPLSKSYHEDPVRLRSLFSYSFNLFLLAGVPVGLGFFVFRSEFLSIVFGKSYLPAAPMLGWVIWTLPLIFLVMPLGVLLAAADKQRFVTISSFITAGANVLLNLALIPSLRGRGAAIGTTATEVIGVCILLTFVLRFIPGVIERGMALALTLFHGTAIALVLLLDGAGLAARAGLFLVYLCAALLWGLFLIRRRRGQRGT
jgi:polysaccharide transporter, PST family